MLLDRPAHNLKMADTYPADFFVPVKSFTDPSEVRPSDDQAIVFSIRKDVPNKTYIEELNKYVQDPKSFLYVSRISRDRMCVVLQEAKQADMLVNQIQNINIEGSSVSLNFFVAKSVKVIISNAGYGISNSALKKFLTNVRKIRTASSVSELKANVVPDNPAFSGIKSFRRSVFIHPDDVDKLPKGPVKFATDKIGFNVFFEVESPKCFICSETGHFRNNCPKNSENSQTADADKETAGMPGQTEKNERKDNYDENEGEVVDDTSFASPATPQQLTSRPNTSPQDVSPLEQVNSKLPPEAPGDEGAMTFSDELNLKFNFSQMAQGKFNNANKRPLSTTSSETSSSSAFDSNFTFTAPFSRSGQKTSGNAAEHAPKKARTRPSRTKTKSLEEVSSKISSMLEPARAHIESSEKELQMNFDGVVNLLACSSMASPDERRGKILSLTHRSVEVVELMRSIYSMVKGKGIKAKITSLRKALESGFDADSSSELSLFSESEHSEIE